MKTKTIDLYQFAELPEDIKEKVIESHHDINVGYDWWDFVYHDFYNFTLTFGIEVDLKRTFFTGFYHQGQGSAYTADVDIVKLLRCASNKAWKEYAPDVDFNFPELSASVIRIGKLVSREVIDRCLCDATQ